VSTCTITWKWSDAVEVLDALQRTIYDAPDEFAARLGLSTAGADRAAARRNATVTTVAQLLGPTHELRALLDPALTVARPLTDEFADRTFWEAKGHMVHATSGGRFALRSRYAKRLVAPRALEEMVRWVERWPGSGNPDGGGIGMFSWGGRINRLRATDTAFMHRDTLFLVSMDTSWTGADSPATVRATLDWLDGLHDALGGHLSDSAYQNFIDPQLSNWESAYYGENYARLVAVKRKYDPDDVFRFDQSIGSGRDLSAPAQVEAA
jgi:FAD/FMN-containing dehydrogenase